MKKDETGLFYQNPTYLINYLLILIPTLTDGASNEYIV